MEEEYLMFGQDIAKESLLKESMRLWSNERNPQYINILFRHSFLRMQSESGVTWTFWVIDSNVLVKLLWFDRQHRVRDDFSKKTACKALYLVFWIKLSGAEFAFQNIKVMGVNSIYHWSYDATLCIIACYNNFVTENVHPAESGYRFKWPCIQTWNIAGSTD